MILTRYFTIVIIIFEYSYALSEHDKLTRINKYINEQYLANPIVKIITNNHRCNIKLIQVYRYIDF